MNEQKVSISIPQGVDVERYVKAWNKYRLYSFCDLMSVIAVTEMNIKMSGQDVTMYTMVEKWRIAFDIATKIVQFHIDPDAHGEIPELTNAEINPAATA